LFGRGTHALWIAGVVAVLVLAGAGGYAYLWLEVDTLRRIPSTSAAVRPVSETARPAPATVPPALPAERAEASSALARSTDVSSPSPVASVPDPARDLRVAQPQEVRSRPLPPGEQPPDPAVERAEIEKSMAQSQAAFDAFRAAASPAKGK
jgi:hypothetical protein